MDDVGLAIHMKRAGARVATRLAPSLLSIRMYVGNRDAFWGIAKNIMAGVAGKLIAVPVVMAVVLGIFGTGLAVAATGLAMGDSTLLAVGAGLYGFQTATLIPMKTWQDYVPLKLLAWPLLGVNSIACLIRGAYLQATRSTVSWRWRETKLEG